MKPCARVLLSRYADASAPMVIGDIGFPTDKPKYSESAPVAEARASLTKSFQGEKVLSAKY